MKAIELTYKLALASNDLSFLSWHTIHYHIKHKNHGYTALLILIFSHSSLVVNIDLTFDLVNTTHKSPLTSIYGTV